MIKDILKLNKMREVIRLDKKEENEKPVEFLEYWNHLEGGWEKEVAKPDDWDNVMYRETIYGLDYFVCWDNSDGLVYNYRGHLNSGKFQGYGNQKRNIRKNPAACQRIT